MVIVGVRADHPVILEQERMRCACVHTRATECIALRGPMKLWDGADDLDDGYGREECSCSCHEEEDDGNYDYEEYL